MAAATAAESKALSNAESMKMASRKVSIRVVTLYTLCMLTASFLVPYDHPFLNGGGQSESSHSIFLIAVVQGGLPAAAHFFNAIYMFSAFASGINTMYVSSRVLHTLALRDQTGPEFITRRLRQCHNGVPLRAVLVTGALMCLGYLGTGSSGQVSNSTMLDARIDKLSLTTIEWLVETERTRDQLHSVMFDCVHCRLCYLSRLL